MKRDLEVLRNAFDGVANVRAKSLVRQAARSIVMEELERDFPNPQPRQPRPYKKEQEQQDKELTQFVASKY